MNPNRFAFPHSTSLLPRLLAGFVLLTSVPALQGCGSKIAERESTDTGNPPVIDENRIRVVTGEDGVRVVGEEDSVTPNAEVVVSNASTGDSATTQAAADGSFEVEIGGTTEDDYRVEVNANGRSADVQLSAVGDESSGSDEEPDGAPSAGQCAPPDDLSQSSTTGPQPVCAELHFEAGCVASRGVATADTSCETDADCVRMSSAPSCIDSCSRDVAVSERGAVDLQAAIDEIDDDQCRRFDEAGCSFIAVPCAPDGPWEAGCVQGTCQAIIGCAAGDRTAEQLVADATDDLAAGCTSDEECLAVFAPSCPWTCRGPTIVVAESQLAPLEELRQDVTSRCEEQASFDECDDGLGCTEDDPSAQPVCRMGVCFEEESAPPAPAAGCVWGVDELLAEVGAEVVARQDCGITNGGDLGGVGESYQCFSDAPMDPGAQFGVNNCIDCEIMSYYVSTPSGDVFHVYMESDIYGDPLREARVERCDALDFEQQVTCVGAEELYSCSEPIPQ